MDPIEQLKELFKRFPGIGPRQAERFVYFLLHSNPKFREDLAQSILQIKNSVKQCTECERFFMANNNEPLCKICSDTERNKDLLLIVEKETDIDKIEASGAYKGYYFISKGTLSTLNDSKKHEVFLKRIIEKIKQNKPKELILAFSATFEGEYTSRYIKENIEKMDDLDVTVSLLGRGLASGTEIEYADSETIRYAIKNRFS